jgi:membrane-bound lytic murein transglycosylase F
MKETKILGAHTRRCIWLCFCLLCLLFAGCDGFGTGSYLPIPGRSLEEIKKSGKLRVVTRNAPTTYYIDRTGKQAGPEYDLISAFAASISVEPEFIVKQTIDEILKSFENGEADIAAAGLTITEERRKRYLFAPPYQEITQQVVTRRDHVQPESISELAGLEIRVIANSSYTERLERLKETSYPGLDWETTSRRDTEQLLHDVWAAKLECTIADSNIVDINRRYYPELIAPINLGRAQELGWIIPPKNRKLYYAISRWLTKYKESGRLAHVHEKYYGFFEVFDYVDTSRYIRRIEKRFPKYSDYFRQAAKKHDLPFSLLAAQGYQESHWNASAVSPTGVRGIMMLTLTTAREMGVSNRLDPRQSIFGGAKYLAKLKKSFSKEVTEPDLTWLALAAYNVGRGHVHDAQALARRFGMDPHKWRDIKQVLPMLSEKRYYMDLKHGYARGWEPVRYVQHIREYQHVLKNRLHSQDTEQAVNEHPGAGQEATAAR